MASNLGAQKKKIGYEIIIYITAAIAAVVLCTWIGYVLEDTSTKKGIHLLNALNSLSEYANPRSFIKAFGAVFTGSGIAKKGMVLGLAGGMLIILWKLSGNGKRYHRKGSEHGSARWGNQHEKDIIADTNDFYNNVIAASDVFLVLDRKKRELNEAAAKKSKNNKSDKKSHSPLGNDEKAEEIIPLENEKLTIKKWSKCVRPPKK